MFDYINASQVSGQQFTILNEPVRVYQNSFEYNKCPQDHPDLPDFFTCYLVDDKKAPWEKVQDDKGNDINNLITYNFETKNAVVDEQEVTHMDYNYFNFPAPVVQEKEDGTSEEYRRKWLSGKTRVNVLFTKPIELKTDDGVKSVTHAKLDLPNGVSNKVFEMMAAVNEAINEGNPIELHKFKCSFQYNDKAAPADMYTDVTAKPLKTPIDVEKELEEFKQQKKDFVPPTAPY